MKKLLAVGAMMVLLPVLVVSWPWSTDMMNQPSVKPQEGVMKPFPKRSVPVFSDRIKAKNREETELMKNPIAVSVSSLKTGKQLFQIYCAACHGLTGTLDSPVAAKIGAIPLADDYVQKNMSEGRLFGTITFGSALMPAYGNPRARDDLRGSNDLTVAERWHVINYIKHGLAKDAAAQEVAQKKQK